MYRSSAEGIKLYLWKQNFTGGMHKTVIFVNKCVHIELKYNFQPPLPPPRPLSNTALDSKMALIAEYVGSFNSFTVSTFPMKLYIFIKHIRKSCC